MQQYLKQIGLKMNVNHPTNKNENNSIIRTTKRDNVKKFMDYIYKDADLYMERKRKKFEEFFVK